MNRKEGAIGNESKWSSKRELGRCLGVRRNISPKPYKSAAINQPPLFPLLVDHLLSREILPYTI